MSERHPDFFVALGDMIYADDACAAVGRFGNPQVVGPSPAPRRGPRVLGALAVQPRRPADASDSSRRRPYYAVWDDHETQNDAGPHNQTLPDAPSEPRLAPARAAYVDYQPIVDAERLYRSARWGRHLEVFFLDTRSYRDAQRGPGHRRVSEDDARRGAAALAHRRPRAIEGDVEGRRVERAAVDPDRRRRLGRRRHAAGLRARARRDPHGPPRGAVRNLVWLTTDVHFATGFRSTPFPGFRMLELTSGPLSAGFFPRPDVDPTLHPERLYFHGPTEPVTSIDQARTYFNFGELEIGPVR